MNSVQTGEKSVESDDGFEPVVVRGQWRVDFEFERERRPIRPVICRRAVNFGG